jgi:short-subunit dehydrogenase
VLRIFYYIEGGRGGDPHESGIGKGEMASLSLSGKTAIVTGAASGIGEELAIALCQQGASVLGIDRDAPGLERVATRIASIGQFQAVVCDLADCSAFSSLVDEFTQEHGRLDYLFNNAGIVAGGEFADMSNAQLDRIFDVNLRAVVHGSRAACRHMRQQGFGHIVNTASSAGLMPVGWSAAYSATKHAVVGLSLSLREEARVYGVAVSVACPGLVDTPIIESADNIGDYNYNAVIDATGMSKMSPAAAAEAILHGVKRNQGLIVFPFLNRVTLCLYRRFPKIINYFTSREMRHQ